MPKQLEQMDKPVIAMVNGLAVGAGMGMCVMCDMRVAAESARFSTGYVRVGLVPGDGDTYFLPRLVGAAKALELLWTADFIEAPEAHRLGIVQRVVPDAQLQDATYALARQIADGPQIPVRMIKRLVYQSLRLDLRTHLDLVVSHMSIVRQTADHAGGRGRLQGEAPGEVPGTLALRVISSLPVGAVSGAGPRWGPWDHDVGGRFEPAVAGLHLARGAR